MSNVDLRGKPGDRDRGPCTHDVDRVIAGGTGNRHSVRHAVGAEVERDLRDTGAGKVTDRDVVGTAAGVELDVLYAVQIHGDVGNVAGEFHVPMVGRDADVLVDIRAVEQERVDAGTAIDHVVAVTRIPDEGVVAGTELRGVAAAPTSDEIVAVAADQRVVDVTAGDRVVAAAPVERELNQVGKAVSRRDDVVAATGV